MSFFLTVCFVLKGLLEVSNGKQQHIWTTEINVYLIQFLICMEIKPRVGLFSHKNLRNVLKQIFADVSMVRMLKTSTGFGLLVQIFSIFGAKQVLKCYSE